MEEQTKRVEVPVCPPPIPQLRAVLTKKGADTEVLAIVTKEGSTNEAQYSAVKNLANLWVFTGMGPIREQGGWQFLKSRPSPSRTFGYVTDAQRGYKDSGDTETESEGKGSSYYMRRQAKNLVKAK